MLRMSVALMSKHFWPLPRFLWLQIGI
uniref:Uncharacterized protein n=1 Tax=Arundo donax TaxID=35708 RepID=A0A0A9BZJ5_ARUDO